MNYDEIMLKVHTLARWYYQKYNIKPNTVMMNRDTYYDLKSSNEYIRDISNEQPITLMGMKIQVTDTDNIKLGYMIDVVE